MAGRRTTKPVANNNFKTQTAIMVAKDKPFKSYIKAILGKLQVMTLNPFSNEVESVLLFGNPKSSYKEDCIIDVWTEAEDKFLRKNNRYHFEMGQLIPYERTEFNVQSEEEIFNSMPDKDLLGVINGPYVSLLAFLDKLTSPAPVSRMISLAEDAEKSEKIVSPIKRKLEELQAKEFTPVPDIIEYEK
jgi:hypothetical protein